MVSVKETPNNGICIVIQRHEVIQLRESLIGVGLKRNPVTVLDKIIASYVTVADLMEAKGSV